VSRTVGLDQGLERLSIMPLPCRAQAGVLLVVLLGRCTRLANCTHDLFTPSGPDRIAGGDHRADAAAGCHRSGPAPDLADPVFRVESCVGMYRDGLPLIRGLLVTCSPEFVHGFKAI